MSDFFLIERASQVQRLRASQASPSIQIPGRMARVGHSRAAKKLYQCIDEICAIKISERREKWISRMAQRGAELLRIGKATEMTSEPGAELSARHRQALHSFDRYAVEFALEPICDTNRNVVVAEAILQDLESFNGLKPIALYADDVAYELLYPTWLNLYTAMRTAWVGNDESLTDAQFESVFRFLRDVDECADDGSFDDLCGAMALAIRFLDRQQALETLQRVLHLGSVCDGRPESLRAEVIRAIHEIDDSAEGFMRRWQAVVGFDTVTLLNHTKVKYDLGVSVTKYPRTTKKLAKFLRDVVRAAFESGDVAYALQTTELVARFADRGGKFSEEFAKWLPARKKNLTKWLAVLSPACCERALAEAGQKLLVHIAAKACDGKPVENLPWFESFLSEFLPRLNLLSDASIVQFERDFVASSRNWPAFVKSMLDPEHRGELAAKLLAAARKAPTYQKMLGQMGVSAALNSAWTMEQIASIGRTLTVLNIMEKEGFMNAGQIEALTSDIRKHLPESMETLITPISGAAGADERLARLYLALNEECEQFSHSGQTGNYGHTSAAYGKLSRRIQSLNS